MQGTSFFFVIQGRGGAVHLIIAQKVDKMIAGRIGES